MPGPKSHNEQFKKLLTFNTPGTHIHAATW